MKDTRKRRRARHGGQPPDRPHDHVSERDASRSLQKKGNPPPQQKKRGRHDADSSVVRAPLTSRAPLPAKAAKWKFPDPQEWAVSDDERERRRKKPRVATGGGAVASKPTFAIAPTPRRRALNRKKLSASEKQRLKQQEREAHARVAPAFSRGSSASVRKLLALQLGDADLDGDLEAFARFVALTPDERAFRLRSFVGLRALIRRVFPGATVELYGSSSSGMETFRSDLDITVGNLDFSKMRDVEERVPAVKESDTEKDDDEDVEEDENRANEAGYVVSDTDGASSASEDNDDDEPTFSLNLSLPGDATADREPAPVAVAASAALKSPWNPTLRRQKMRQLRALQQILAAHRPQFQIKCLSKAKIPILMIVDSASGLHIDLGVNREAFHASDHGRTTALVAQLQRDLGAPFFSIVVFLKEFLHQFDLDKPFTGGLGSYRLYMMVAYIFTTRFAAKAVNGVNTKKKRRAPSGFSDPQPVSPAKVLLTFLGVFGNREKRGFFTSSTELPVRHGALMDVVEFSAVFRLDDCVDKFAMAFDIISKQRGLGGVVYEDALQSERRDCAKRIIQQLEKEENQQKQRAAVPENPPAHDEEAEVEDVSSDDEDEKWFYDKHGR